jgi:hypothetical protein
VGLYRSFGYRKRYPVLKRGLVITYANAWLEHRRVLFYWSIGFSAGFLALLYVLLKVAGCRIP